MILLSLKKLLPLFFMRHNCNNFYININDDAFFTAGNCNLNITKQHRLVFKVLEFFYSV